jgi:hypothetical protein
MHRLEIDRAELTGCLWNAQSYILFLGTGLLAVLCIPCTQSEGIVPRFVKTDTGLLW